MISTFKDINIQNDFGNTLKSDYLQDQIDNQLGSDLDVILQNDTRYLALKSKSGQILSLLQFPANAIIVGSLQDIELILNEGNVGRVFLYIGETTLDRRYIKGNFYLIEEQEV